MVEAGPSAFGMRRADLAMTGEGCGNRRTIWEGAWRRSH
jgi:hypothetical protein